MSAVTADPDVQYGPDHKPFPLAAHLIRHPIVWMKRTVGGTVGGLGAVHVGTLAIVGVYYILFQTIPGVKYDWDHLLTGQFHLWGWYPTHRAALSAEHWAYYRHMIRGVGEGLLGGTLGQMVVVNYYRRQKDKNLLDDLEVGLGIPNAKHVHEGNRLSTGQVLASPLLILLYAVPGFAIGAGAIALLHHWIDFHTASPGSHASLWTYTKQIWTSNYDQKLVGLFASVIFARRITKALGLNSQSWFAEHRRRAGRGLRFYHWLSPTFMGRFTGIPERVYAGTEAEGRHSGLQVAVMSGGLVLLIALAGFGYYVLTVIAKA